MSFPLWDLAKDIAVARGGRVGFDPMDPVDSRTTRRRLAAIAWVPGAGAALVLGGWTHSWVIGLIAFAVLIAGLWLFTEGTGGIRARLRRRS
jgi:hypothetical protein